MPPYKKPSNDPVLVDFAKQHNARYLMSTSTISSALSQIYFLLTSFENPTMKFFNTDQTLLTKQFMSSQRKPITNIVRKMENNLYAMDSDKSPFESNVQVLMDMGKILERMYTMDIDRFRKCFINGYKEENIEGLIDEDYHRYFIVNDEICLRSQIDCKSERDGETIVYEVKTRAVAPIRYDLANYTDYMDYKIDRVMGIHSSYEREYYDLIRGGFLKYFFQLKIGQMDGAMIGYHNTQRHFGFEYISLKTIEENLFGNAFRAEQIFTVLNKILCTLLDNVIRSLESESYSFFRLGKLTRPLLPIRDRLIGGVCGTIR